MAQLIVLAATLFLATSVSAAPNPSLEQAIRERLAGSVTPGLAVAVVERGGTITQMAFGRRDAEKGDLVTPATVFRNGSASKMWVAAALIKAMKKRGLKLSAPIGTFVPNSPVPLRRLTVHQLLTHSSGLVDATNDFGPADEAALARRVKEGKFAFFAPQEAVFSYANPGYDLAGYVLEVISGRPFADAMNALLFKPAGMNQTFYRPSTASKHILALGHTPGEGKQLVAGRQMPDNASERPSGMAFTTALDSALFARMLMRQGRPALDAGTVAALTQSHIVLSNSPPSSAYAYGLTLSTGSRRVWEHAGSLTGYLAHTTILPDEGVAVVVLSNGRAMPLLLEVTDLILADRGVTAIPREEPKLGQAGVSFEPLPSALAASLAGQWGQDTPALAVRAEADGPALLRGDTVMGTLRSAGGDRLAIINPKGRFGGYLHMSRGPAGQVLFLRIGMRAFARLNAAVLK